MHGDSLVDSPSCPATLTCCPWHFHTFQHVAGWAGAPVDEVEGPPDSEDDLLPIWPKHSGLEGPPRAQELTPHLCPQTAQLLCHERNCVPILVQHCVAVGLLKAKDDCSPAHMGVLSIRSARMQSQSGLGPEQCRQAGCFLRPTETSYGAAGPHHNISMMMEDCTAAGSGPHGAHQAGGRATVQ